jgi:hypothetical protein
MLTLKNPFLASSFVATSERVLHETPAAIRAFHPSVPNALVSVVMKAMAKAPAQRYVHVRELLDDLRLVYRGPTPSKLTAVRTRRKQKRWLVAGIVLTLIAVAGFAVYWWDHRSPILGERGWVLIADFEAPGEATIPDKGCARP